VLLDPLEKQLHLPSAPVALGKIEPQGFQVSTIAP
jgi:hypothetical protein